MLQRPPTLARFVIHSLLDAPDTGRSEAETLPDESERLAQAGVALDLADLDRVTEVDPLPPARVEGISVVFDL